MPRGQARRPRCPAGQHRNAEGECVPREEVFANIEARRRERQQGQRGRARRDNTAQSPRAGGSATAVPDFPPPRSEATPPVDAPRPPTTAPPRGRGARGRGPPINPGENIPQTRTVNAPIPDDDYEYEYGALYLDNYNILTGRAVRGTRSAIPIRVYRSISREQRRRGRGEALDDDGSENTPIPRRRITLASGVVPTEEEQRNTTFQRDRRGREYYMQLGRRVYVDDALANMLS